MIFLVHKDGCFVRQERGRWTRCSLPKEFVNTDLVFGFYKQDFLQWRRTKVSFFELGRFLEPEEPLDVVQEFVELCIENGLVHVESGRMNTIAYARRLLERELKELLTVDVDEHEEKAYYGGRTEFYTMSAQGHIRYYDMNSAYAWAMTFPFPDKRKEIFYKNLSYEQLLDLSQHYYVLFEAEVLQEKNLPVCPVKIEEETFFPVGKLDGIWTSFELSLLEKDEVLRVHRVWVYPYTDHGLKDVVYELYEKRGQSKAHKAFYKWQLVLLYGLIGWKQKGMPKSRLIGGYITARVRHALYTKMLMAQENGQLLYCDTDAFFLLSDQEGHEKVSKSLPVAKGLGNWGIREEINQLEVLGYKRYVLKTDGRMSLVFSGDRVDMVDENGNFWRKNFYTGNLEPVEHHPQERPKRKFVNGLSLPWHIRELSTKLGLSLSGMSF